MISRIAVAVAALAASYSVAHAASMPGWLLGRWNAVGLMAPSELADFGPEHADALLKDATKLAVDIRANVITSVPAALYDLIEGDGLSATVRHGTIRSLFREGRFGVAGQPMSISPDDTIDYVSITMQHCVINSNYGLAMTRDGHGIPVSRLNKCEPVRIYHLADDHIGWPASLGWIVFRRAADVVAPPSPPTAGARPPRS